jgi:tellurium resistance protein TerD
MSVSLGKSESISLAKAAPSLKTAIVGLGWDPRKKSGPEYDLDASAVLLESGSLKSDKDIVFYGNKNRDVVYSTGDNLTGAGDGDDETIVVKLSEIPESYTSIPVFVNIYECKSRHQQFGDVDNAFIRVVDKDTGTEICRYDLSGDYKNKTAVIFGEFYREDGGWSFRAIGEGTTDESVQSICRRWK